jgi:antitoxin component YwqK of YwqJK toxin-antitoxin module
MKKLLFILLPFLFITGCHWGTHKEIEQKYPDGSAKIEKYYTYNKGKKVLVKEVQYYENKQMKMEGNYNNNLRNGKWTAWYKNGKIWSEGFFKDGLSEGVRTVYYDNGNKYMVGSYSKDEKVGKWQFFDNTGKLVKEVDFDKK